jgi:16S rRNA (cytidine1402-2'-O)-methyltransferase
MAGRLYVVATPIGHLSDLSQRAARTLAEVDVVAAEDTRVTRVLLRHVGSHAKAIAAHAHNAPAAGAAVLAHLADGRSVALVSDAGTPAISDPGNAIVAAAHEAGFEVVPIPGPSAVTALLSVAGLSDGPFLFEGFLPSRPKARDARLAVAAGAAASAGAVLVLYEAPHRIADTLQAVARQFGEGRRIAIGRELTKTFEELYRGPAGGAPAWLDERPERRRGEFVIAVDRAEAAAEGAAEAGEPARRPAAPDPEALLARLLEDLSPSRAVKLAQDLTGLAHRDLYARALAIRSRGLESGE